MLELGKHSKKLHESIVPNINKTKIDKVFVIGKKVVSYLTNFQKLKKEEFYTIKLKLLN